MAQSVVPATPDNSTLPVTITGEKAPPLNVAPPPELVPQVSPNLPVGTAPVVPANAALTLDQAVAIAFQHLPALGIAQQSVAAAAGKVQQAKSALLPGVSVSSGVSNSSVSGGNSTSSSGGYYSATASARQLLFDFGQTTSAVQSARAQESAQRANLVGAGQDLEFSVKQAFFTLLQNQRLSAISQQTVDAQRSHLDEAKARFSAGSVSEADVVTAQANLAEALLSLSTARYNVQVARANLNLAMGVDVRTPLQPADIPAPTTTLPELNALVDQALSGRPEVLAARDAVLADEASVRGAKAGNLPAVVAEGSLGTQGPSLSDSTKTGTVGVSLQWSIYDSGAVRGAVRVAEANLATARLQLTQVRQVVSNDVTQSYLSVTNAQQRVITTDAEVANAQEALRLTEGRYRAGVAILLEVIDAQNTLATAQANQAAAIYGLDIALAALDHAVGRSVETGK